MEQNNIVPTGRAYIIRNNCALLALRAGNFFFHALRTSPRCFVFDIALFHGAPLFADLLLLGRVFRYEEEAWTAASRRRHSGQVVSRNCGRRGQQIACFRASLHHSVTLLTLAGNPSAYLV